MIAAGSSVHAEAGLGGKDDAPSHWPMHKMGDVAKVVGGGTPTTSRPDYFEGDIPWITPADLTGYKAKYISRGARSLTKEALDSCGAKMMPAGTVLFSSRAPIGYVAIAANPVCTNQGFKSFVLDDRLRPEFVYYYLHHAKPIAVSLASGTTFLEISGRSAAEIPVPVPSHEEQDRVVDHLDLQFSRLDAAVEALKRAQANLKRYRASVLKAACEGRLVPAEADLARLRSPLLSLPREEGVGGGEGLVDPTDHPANKPTDQPTNPPTRQQTNTPTFENGDALLARILEERRRTWKGKGKYKEPAAPDTTNLPKLPEGWTWATVEQLALLVTDGDHNPPKRTTDGVPHLTAKHIQRAGIDFKECTYISAQDAQRVWQRYQPEAGDLIVTCVGTVGRTAIVRGNRPFSPDRNLAAIRPRDGLLVTYLNGVIAGPAYQKRIHAASGSTAQPHLYLGDLRALPVPLPPLAEQERIVAEVERRLSVADALEATLTANLSRATRLRQAVLQKAFSGSPE